MPVRVNANNNIKYKHTPMNPISSPITTKIKSEYTSGTLAIFLTPFPIPRPHNPPSISASSAAFTWYPAPSGSLSGYKNESTRRKRLVDVTIISTAIGARTIMPLKNHHRGAPAMKNITTVIKSKNIAVEKSF